MSLDVKFPRTLKAAKQCDLAGWMLGDALLAEVKDQDSGSYGYNAVISELASYGIVYTGRYLRLLRQTAEDFPSHSIAPLKTILLPK